MLQEIKELQNRAVSQLVNLLETNKSHRKEFTFKAPTGSGKTYMMADFINRIISAHPDIIFIVSSLSKADLAKQNYQKFCEYTESGNFQKVKPYLITSEISGEESLFIPTDYNVYFLARDLYKNKSLLMQGPMEKFFRNITQAKDFQGQEKQIIWIKDESHQKAKHLEEAAKKGIFRLTLNFSATPNLKRGQLPDVEITEEDAENVNLIKTVEWGKETDTVETAIKKFTEIKENYRNKLGVNPCLIIQISNKDKAEEELNNKIFPALKKYTDLKWILIVNNDKDCDTNDVFKAKKLPVSKWKSYAKENTSGIDVIIFKMVVSEGWDIPRACMLYQVRETQSDTLDEQVIGRVRRNPRLLDFETLDKEAQKLALTAWIWGNPKNKEKIYYVKLKKDLENNNIKIKTTKLKALAEKVDFNLENFLKGQKVPLHHKSIFEIGRKLNNCNNEVRESIYNYATDYTKWFEVTQFINEIEQKNNEYYCNYADSMKIAEEVPFAPSSHYSDKEKHVIIDNWIWNRQDNEEEFSFDSDAERDWADILKNLSTKCFAEQKIKSDELFNNSIYIWGKNFLPNSSIKFEYYLHGIHSSFPDFIIKDKAGKIHLFEVKSINKAKNSEFDEEEYKNKVIELKKAYKQASKITEQIFYLPLKVGKDWQITQFINGEEKTLTKQEFKNFIGDIANSALK